MPVPASSSLSGHRLLLHKVAATVWGYTCFRRYVFGVGIVPGRFWVWMRSWGCFSRILGGGGGAGWAEKYDGEVEGRLDFG